MPRKIIIAIAVGVLLAYNIVSIGLAYRAGQQSIQDKQLQVALHNINTALAEQKKQTQKYEALSKDFALNTALTREQMQQTESNINDYLQHIKHRIECIDGDAMRLLNEQITHANGATSAATSSDERAYPLRTAAAD